MNSIDTARPFGQKQTKTKVRQKGSFQGATNIFRMDIHRLLHSPVFYVSIGFITIMALALVMSGMSTTLDSLLGAAGAASSLGADEGAAFMTSALGTGVIFILVSIILTLFVCKDYSGGFAKNIFTVHANPVEYITGKLMLVAAVSGFLMILYVLESVLSLAILGGGVVLSGGIGGLLTYLLEKWILSIALCSVILLVSLFTRNIAWGVIAGFLISTGGLSMGAVLFGQMLGINGISTITSFTISGASHLASLTFDPMTFLQITLSGLTTE